MDTKRNLQKDFESKTNKDEENLLRVLKYVIK